MTAAPPRPRPSPTAPRTSRGGRRGLWPAAGVLTLAVLVLAIAGVAASATSETTAREDSFAAAHLDALDVELQAGTVRVVVEDREAVAVTTRLTSGRWADATADVALADGRLSVVGGCTRALFFSRCRTEHEIALPPATAARIQVTATAGHVEIDGFAGSVEATSTAGSIDLSRFSGDSALLETAAGAITVDARTAPRALEATTAAGRITVTVPDEAYRVSADTVAGRVAVRVREDDAADRALTLRSTAGSITVDPRPPPAAAPAEEPALEAPGDVWAPRG